MSDERLFRALQGDLLRLDPWSFRILPGEPFDLDDVVLGTTGAFAIRVVDEPGSVMVGKRPPGLRGLAKRARGLTRRLFAVGIQVRTGAVLCSVGTEFAPRTVRGVRVLPRALLVREISERPRLLLPHQAERAARSLLRPAS